MRVQIVHALEEGFALQLLAATGGEHDRDGGVPVPEGFELRQRGLRRRTADHAVVARVALELARDPLERLRVLVDCEDQR